MNTHKKQWPFLLISLLIIIILSCSFLYLKHLFFSEQAPKLKIYQAIDSPDKKYKAIYYNIDEGVDVSNYDHIAIKDNSFNTTDSIDEFMPYSDRVLSIDNNHSSIDFYWESNSCLVVEYKSQEVESINIKESIFTKSTFTHNNESSIINIKYIYK